MRLSRLSLPAAAIVLASCSAPTTATNPAHGTVRMMRRNPIIDAERYFSEMSPGTVAFDVPKEVRIAVSSPVVLRLTPKGKSIGGIEHVTPIMEVHLDGGERTMEVRSLTQDEQRVAGGRSTEWRWDVTSNRSGKQRLTAVVIAHLRLYDHDEQRQVLTLTRDVNVRAHFLDFFTDHWILYLMLTIGGPMVWSVVGPIVRPIAGALWEEFRSRKDRPRE